MARAATSRNLRPYSDGIYIPLKLAQELIISGNDVARALEHSSPIQPQGFRDGISTDKNIFEKTAGKIVALWKTAAAMGTKSPVARYDAAARAFTVLDQKAVAEKGSFDPEDGTHTFIAREMADKVVSHFGERREAYQRQAKRDRSMRRNAIVTLAALAVFAVSMCGFPLAGAIIFSPEITACVIAFASTVVATTSLVITGRRRMATAKMELATIHDNHKLQTGVEAVVSGFRDRALQDNPDFDVAADTAGLGKTGASRGREPAVSNGPVVGTSPVIGTTPPEVPPFPARNGGYTQPSLPLTPSPSQSDLSVDTNGNVPNRPPPFSSSLAD